MTKIDILLNFNELISEVEDVTTTYKIDELSGEKLTSYDNFMTSVNSKNPQEYNHVFLTDADIKRYVLILQKDLVIISLQDVYYDDLSDEDKLTFDKFYNTFTV